MFSGDAKATSYYRKLFSSMTPFSIPPSTACAAGPVYKDYTEEGYFFWPPIRYWSCDGLIVPNHKICVTVHACVKYRWAVVYKCNKFRCYYDGTRYIRYTEDLDCYPLCNIYQCCPQTFHFHTTLCRCQPDLF